MAGSFPAIHGSTWDFEDLDFSKEGTKYRSREYYESQLRGKNEFAADMIAHGSLPLNEWIRLFRHIQKHGIRNCHTTFLMPTGTVSYICNSTESSGIEPLFSLTPIKRKIANTDNKGSTYLSEHKLDYPTVVIQYCERVLGMNRAGFESGKEKLDESKLPSFFEIALTISPEDHVRMAAAAQRFIHNGISKTINLPEQTEISDIRRIYQLAYRLKARGVTVYRNHSKPEQIIDLQTGTTNKRLIPKAPPKLPLAGKEKAALHRIPDADAHRIGNGDSRLYVVVTLLADDKGRDWPIEVFVKFDNEAKETHRDQAKNRNAICRLVSNSLRHGVPITDVIKNLEGASGSPGDFCCQLSKILKQHLADAMKDVHDKDIPKNELDLIRPACPNENCDGRMEFIEGCLICPVCSLSKC